MNWPLTIRCQYRRWFFGIPGPYCPNPGQFEHEGRVYCHEHEGGKER